MDKPDLSEFDYSVFDWSKREVPPEKRFYRDPNSMDLDPETIYAYLTLGTRTPQNDDERELLKEIRKIRRDGYTVDIPSNGI